MANRKKLFGIISVLLVFTFVIISCDNGTSGSSNGSSSSSNGTSNSSPGGPSGYYVTKTGEKYHKYGHLGAIIPLSEGTNGPYTACKTCF